MTDENLLPDLRTEEGLRLYAYPDPLTHGAPWTIGYGDATAHPGQTETPDVAEERLEAQVVKVEAQLDASIPWWRGLNPARQDVLVDMAFNMGVGTLDTFKTFLLMVQSGRYAEAAQDGLHTLWARQVGHRAHRLMCQMALGEHCV